MHHRAVCNNGDARSILVLYIVYRYYDTLTRVRFRVVQVEMLRFQHTLVSHFQTEMAYSLALALTVTGGFSCEERMNAVSLVTAC